MEDNSNTLLHKLPLSSTMITLRIHASFLHPNGLQNNNINKPPMKSRQRQAHMKVAYVYADLSYCDRRKVGCVIVKDDRIVSIGYNGTPPGHDNCCEDSTGKTKSEVIHAESNAIRKLKHTHPELLEGSTCFVTTVPCPNCTEEIIDAKIAEVNYVERRRTKPDGVDRLLSHGIVVEQLTL